MEQHSMLTSQGDDEYGQFNIFGGIRKQFETIKQDQPDKSDTLEYLFEDEYVPNGPSWGARICYGTGMTYIVGLSAGGFWGLTDGLWNPAGLTSRRLRINCILNSCTARGPFVANNLGMLALLYNLFHGALIKSRGGEYDVSGSVASATAAGMLYKSTKGVRMMGIAGAAFGTGMLAYQLAKKHLEASTIEM